MINLSVSVILPGVGHWTRQERPAEFSRLMTDFLRSLPK
jgi:pimeloyl-ACP methyl ester carboxylesterase